MHFCLLVEMLAKSFASFPILVQEPEYEGQIMVWDWKPHLLEYLDPWGFVVRRMSQSLGCRCKDWQGSRS